jgi:hypothetical protein
MKKSSLLVILAICLSSALHAAEPYKADFEKSVIGKVPDDLLILDGAFSVKEEEGNKFLELPGAPLDTFGVLFGPNLGANTVAKARIFSTAKGRRYPVFSLGLNGNGGYKLLVAPAKKAVELYRGETVVATVPFDWQAGKWTLLKLQVSAVGDRYKVEGKVWAEKTEEPKGWLISYEDSNKPSDGRASVSGNPFSGTPIRFDDLEVGPL